MGKFIPHLSYLKTFDWKKYKKLELIILKFELNVKSELLAWLCILAGGKIGGKVDQRARLGQTKGATVASAIGGQFLDEYFIFDNLGGWIRF